MSWVAVGSAAATIGSALISSDSSRKAANKQADAAKQADARQREMFDLTREDQRPYREAGYGALEQIKNLLKSPDAVTKEPGYQFGLEQGARALNSGAAARGMTYSGAAGKALTRYGQDYAGTKLDQSYNRLASLAGLGQVGVNGQNNQNYGNNTSANMIGLGNAQAAQSLYNGRTWGNALNSLASMGSGEGYNARTGGGGINWGGGGLGGFSMGDLLGGKGLGGGL